MSKAFGLSPVATRSTSRVLFPPACVARPCDDSMSGAPGLVCDSRAVAQATARLLTTSSFVGEILSAAVIEHDLPALSAALPESKSVCIVANCDPNSVFEDVGRALTTYFVDPQMTCNKSCVYQNKCGSFVIHKDSSGSWRVGTAIGKGETVLFSASSGGTKPPIAGWLNVHGDPMNEILVVEQAIWSNLVAEYLQNKVISLEVRLHAAEPAADPAVRIQLKRESNPVYEQESELAVAKKKPKTVLKAQPQLVPSPPSLPRTAAIAAHVAEDLSSTAMMPRWLGGTYNANKKNFHMFLYVANALLVSAFAAINLFVFVKYTFVDMHFQIFVHVFALVHVYALQHHATPSGPQRGIFRAMEEARWPRRSPHPLRH